MDFTFARSRTISICQTADNDTCVWWFCGPKSDNSITPNSSSGVETRIVTFGNSITIIIFLKKVSSKTGVVPTALRKIILSNLQSIFRHHDDADPIEKEEVV